MGRTIVVHGSDEVMAMFGSSGTFYRGKWENVKITGLSPDKDTPLEVRTALMGLIIPTIFTKESIEKQTGTSFGIPDGSRLAYASDVIERLKTAGKYNEAEQLRHLTPEGLDMYVVDSKYELAQK